MVSLKTFILSMVLFTITLSHETLAAFTCSDSNHAKGVCADNKSAAMMADPKLKEYYQYVYDGKCTLFLCIELFLCSDTLFFAF